MEKKALSLRFQAEDFNTEWVRIDDAGLLGEVEKRNIVRNYYQFIHDIAKALEVRFLESVFVLAHCSFVDPTRRRQLLNIQPVMQRFDQNKQFYADACLCQTSRYCHDVLLNFVLSF